MRCTRDDALDILSKWSKERPQIEIVFDGRLFRGSLRGLLLLKEDRVAVFSESTGSLSFLMSDAESFEYTEPQEAPDFARKEVEEMLVCGLFLSLRSGERLFLYELISPQ